MVAYKINKVRDLCLKTNTILGVDQLVRYAVFCTALIVCLDILPSRKTGSNSILDSFVCGYKQCIAVVVEELHVIVETIHLIILVTCYENVKLLLCGTLLGSAEVGLVNQTACSNDFIIGLTQFVELRIGAFLFPLLFADLAPSFFLSQDAVDASAGRNNGSIQNVGLSILQIVERLCHVTDVNTWFFREDAFSLVLQLETTLYVDDRTILVTFNLYCRTVLCQEIYILAVDWIGAIVYDSVALQHILQTVGSLTL